MEFKDIKREVYKNNPIIEAVLQFRFPPILSINTKEPAEFQEKIRSEFPIYQVLIEQEQQLVFNPNIDVVPSFLPTNKNKNHCFTTEDNSTRINITNTYISLSTNKYTKWEDFINKFKNPFNSFVKLYNPIFFERTGLRYVDAFNKSKLNLTNCEWKELISPSILGFLSFNGLSENDVNTSVLDAEIKLDDNVSMMKLHAGLGIVNNDHEKSFIIDSDFYTNSRIGTDIVFEKAEYLHKNSTNFIRSIILEKLQAAMEPQEHE